MNPGRFDVERSFRSGPGQFALKSRFVWYLAEASCCGESKSKLAQEIEVVENVEPFEKLGEGLLQIVRYLPYAVAAFDRDVRYIAHSDRWLADYGLGDQSLIGRSHYDVFPEIPQRWKDIHQSCLRGEVVVNPEDSFVREDGRTDWLRYEVRPWRDASGEIRGILMLTEVITDRKLAQLALEEREQRLTLVNKKLASANKELESILYAASHDLRNPLVNLEGFTGHLGELLEELRETLSGEALSDATLPRVNSLLDKQLPEALGFVRAGGTKLGELISGLLRVSRVGRQAMYIADVDMNDLLKQVVDSQAYEAGEAGAEVKIDALPACRADRAMLSSVFSNLVENAVKYRDRDKLCRIRVHGEIRDDYVVYFVDDNGPGIAPLQRERVFNVFDRLYPNRDVPGEGIGLSIVRRLVERHGGSAAVSESPDGGCRFEVSLPLNPIDESGSGEEEKG